MVATQWGPLTGKRQVLPVPHQAANVLTRYIPADTNQTVVVIVTPYSHPT